MHAVDAPSSPTLPQLFTRLLRRAASFITIVGGVVLACGLMLLWDAIQFSRSAERTTARVDQVIERNVVDEEELVSTRYRAIVVFSDQQGKPRRGMLAESRQVYLEGQSVDIQYDRDTPTSILPANWRPLRGAGVTIPLTGALMLGVGIVAGALLRRVGSSAG
jgi:hypothetical protein